MGWSVSIDLLYVIKHASLFDSQRIYTLLQPDADILRDIAERENLTLRVELVKV